MSIVKLLEAKSAFGLWYPYTESEELSGSCEAVALENNAFELALAAGVNFEDDEFNHCTDQERLLIMVGRIDDMIKKVGDL